MSFPFDLNRKASVVVSQNDYGGSPTNLELILNQQSSFIDNRMIYCKEANTGLSQPRFLTISTFGYTISNEANNNTIYLYSNDAIQLHLFSNNWTILGGFSPSGGGDLFPKSFSTIESPPYPNVVIVDPSMDSSLLFVDLRTQSKVISLPLISTFFYSRPSNMCPYYTIKDVYGNSAVSSLYIYTDYTDENNIIESQTTVSNSTRINSNYASIDIFPNLTNNTWHILNYFNGQVSTAGYYTTEDVEVPISNTYYLSSSLTYVNTDEETKLILLPPASEHIGASFYIKDYTGNAFYSSIFISTQLNDLMDDSLSSIVLGYNYHSARITAFSSTRYSITLDYPWNDLPFLAR